MTALKVFHIASGDLWAGAEVQTAQLLLELKKDPFIRIEAALFNKGVLYDKLMASGITTHFLNEDKQSSLQILRGLYTHCKHWEPDVVHTHRYKENCLGGLAASASNVPVIVHTVHGLQEALGGLENLKLNCYSLVSSQITRRVASGLIGVSREIAAYLEVSFPKARVVCIHNGINSGLISGGETSNVTRGGIGIAEAAYVVGTVGRLSPVKGIEYLLQAVSLLVNEWGLEAIQVAIIGGGPLQEQLEALSRELAIAQHVRFLGERRDVPDLLKLLDVFVMPSLHEGIPMALLEAMGAGCPIVASAVGGIPEVVRDGTDGMLVPAKDPKALAQAINALYVSELDRSRFGHAGRMRVAADFDAEQMAARTKDFYVDLLSRSK